MDDNSPWRTVIKLKYCTEAGEWFTSAPRGSYGVVLWEDISKETELMKNDSLFELGDGCRIKFWENVWCGETLYTAGLPLWLFFGNIYLITDQKNNLIDMKKKTEKRERNKIHGYVYTHISLP